MELDFWRLAERRMLAARAEGKLSNLEGEGEPLPDHPEAAYLDPLEAIGFRIMHEAGFVPQELELGKQLIEAREAYKATNDPAEQKEIMARIADLEMRRNIARETRLHFMHHE